LSPRHRQDPIGEVYPPCIDGLGMRLCGSASFQPQGLPITLAVVGEIANLVGKKIRTEASFVQSV